MKRQIKIAGLIILSILFISSVCFAQEIGKFTSVEGRVDVLKTGKTDVLPVAVRDSVSSGDIIRTKSLSKAEVKFSDNSVLRLAENTKVQIQEYLIDKDGLRNTATINVERGKIRAVVSKTKGPTNFFVNTPDTCGSVKGSDIFLFYQKSTTGILVKEGSLSTFNNTFPENVIEVPKGNTLVILPDQPPQNPRPYLELELKRYETDTMPVLRKVKEDPSQIKGSVMKLIGDVRIRTKGTISWHPARLNEVVWAGDEIQTQENGKIEILLDNNNIINLKPNSKIILKNLSRNLKTDEYENLIEANIGKVRATVKELKGNSKFQIKTPTAVAAVRGTSMYLDILPNLTTLYMQGGRGILTSIISGISKIVNNGQSATADDKGNVSDPQDASDEEESEFEEGWEPELGDDEYGYSPPGGGDDFEDMPETDEGITGAPEGYQDNSVNVPFEPGTTTTVTTPMTDLYGTFSGYFGYLGSFIIGGGTFIEATFSSTTSVAPWSGISTTTLSGTYDNNELSFWLGDLTGTGSDGGAFVGWVGGTFHNSWEGALASIYIDSSGTAGTITGYLSGENDDITGTFTGTGEIFALPITETDILPADLSSSITQGSDSNWYNLYGFFDEGNGSLDFSLDRNYMSINIDEVTLGIWQDTYSGVYNRPDDSEEWIGIAGGGYGNSGYYFSAIEGIDDLNGALRIDIIGAYLDYYKLGAYYGTILGTYESYYFEGLGLGTYIEEPLTWSARIDAAYHYYDEWGDYIDYYNYHYGIIGSTESPFSSPGTPVDITLMGETYPYGYITWWGYLYGSYADESVIPDGFIAGRTDSIEGMLVSLYIDSSGNAGTLSGSFTGDYYSNLDMWQAQGTLTATQKATGYNPDYYYSNYNYIYGYIYGEFDTGSQIYNYYNINDTSYGNFGSYTTWLINSSWEDESWGIYNIELGGYYDSPTSDKWTLYLGGDSWRGLGSTEYWIAMVTGTQWSEQRIAGSLSGAYLTYTSLGTIEGDILGSYDTESEGVWEAIALGTFEEVPLDFAGEVSGGLLYYDLADNYLYTDGNTWGLLGGVGDLWNETSTIVLIGEYNIYGNIHEPYLWFGSGWYLYSYNDYTGDYTTFDGGAFFGFAGGSWNQNVMLGATRLLYIAPGVGQQWTAGYLSGDLAGAYIPSDIEMWIAIGELTPTPMGLTELNPYNLVWGDIYWDYFEGTGSGVFDGSGSIDALLIEGTLLNIYDQNWGIWNAGFGGTYTGPTSPLFTVAAAGSSSDGIYWLGTASGEWGEGVIAGLFRGFFMYSLGYEGEIETIGAGAMSGDVIGNYIDVDEPGTDTWQAAGVGEWVEVTDLLTSDLLGFTTEELANFVSVPITEVYTNLLTGSNSFITTATMDISLYQNEFNYLWAAWISGAYSGGPSDPALWSLNLNNGDDTVTLNGSQWADGEWLAGVTGTVDGNSITGQAGGTFGDGEFQGVGAGTVVE